VPLYVHEWGVQVFGSDGSPAEAPPVPDWFHTTGPAGTAIASGPAVRDLPPDSGVRTLPIVHFYASNLWGDEIPLAIDVAFTEGDPSVWFPQVSAHTPGDASAELGWDRLSLTPNPQHPANAVTDVTWPTDMRGLDALWVNSASESERFLFYEADTAERSLLSVERGETWSEERDHYVLRNDSGYDVHDVFVVHRDGEQRFVFFAPRIPTGATAGFLLADHAVDEAEFLRRTVDALKARFVDAVATRAPAEVRWDLDDECVMMRDPAMPETTVANHRMFTDEVNAMLGVWQERLFGEEGTTIVYRESTDYLQAMMPLAVYTDMYHYPVISRLGLAVWEDVALP